MVHFEYNVTNKIEVFSDDEPGDIENNNQKEYLLSRENESSISPETKDTDSLLHFESNNDTYQQI